MTEETNEITPDVPEVPPKIIEKVPTRRRGIVIALCILIVALATLNIWSYVTQNTEINNLRSQVSSLEDYKTTHSHNNTEYAQLLDIVNLSKTTVLENNVTFGVSAGQAIHFDYSVERIQYAGYIEVDVEVSTSPNTYVRLTYNEYSVVYDEKIDVGAGGKAVFPVLPGSIRVYVGNTNPIEDSTQTVTITYHY